MSVRNHYRVHRHHWVCSHPNMALKFGVRWPLGWFGKVQPSKRADRTSNIHFEGCLCCGTTGFGDSPSSSKIQDRRNMVECAGKLCSTGLFGNVLKDRRTTRVHMDTLARTQTIQLADILVSPHYLLARCDCFIHDIKCQPKGTPALRSRT